MARKNYWLACSVLCIIVFAHVASWCQKQLDFKATYLTSSREPGVQGLQLSPVFKKLHETPTRKCLLVIDHKNHGFSQTHVI